MHYASRPVALCLALTFGAPALSEALPEEELLRRLSVFGDDFVVEVIEPPVIAEPSQWIRREAGEYVYRFVQGTADSDGNLEQRELHVPDPEQPDRAWQRHIGEKTVESFLSSEDMDVVIIEEIDHQHGFRVQIEPGVHWPAGIHIGDEFAIQSKLAVYPIDGDEISHHGQLNSLITYEGAFRIRTPAGTFDTILLREDFILHIGPLKAEDDRFLFYAKGVGLVAEIESTRAGALIVFHMKEDTAKVLISRPGGDAPVATSG